MYMPLKKETISFFIDIALNKDTIFVILVDRWKLDTLRINV